VAQWLIITLLHLLIIIIVIMSQGQRRAPSETLGIFGHKSLDFQVSSIGTVQEDGFCW